MPGVEYFVSDRLMSSLVGAQFDSGKALTQDIKTMAMDLFFYYLNIKLSFNMKLIDKLFNGVSDNKTIFANEKLNVKF